MYRKWRNWTLLLLGLAAVVAFILVRVSGRQPVAKISATNPVRQNVTASISSNGKVEPIAPYVVRAQSDTFVTKVYATEGQNVKKGQLLLELRERRRGTTCGSEGQAPAGAGRPEGGTIRGTAG